jgi:hypothetical protein
MDETRVVDAIDTIYANFNTNECNIVYRNIQHRMTAQHNR